MAGRGKSGDMFYNSTDGESSDEAKLVMSDSELTSGRKKKKYVVAADAGPDGVCCSPRRFSRNEWICIVVGAVAMLAVLVVFVAIGAGLGTAMGVSSSSSSSGNPWESVRLPSSITPEDYDIHLTVDLADFTVIGQSVTNLNIVEETSYIIIHVNYMNIMQHSIKQNGANVAVKSNFTYKENDFYVIRLEKSLSIGKAELDMTFDYMLGEDLNGFYSSSYKDKSGDTHWLATTQFEPTDARNAFPCFDEPALKANFTISVTHDKDLNVHSNMPIERQDPISDTMMKTSFETSVKMSTYLVAFVVSEFECMTTQTRTEKPVNVSVCSNPEVIQHTQYALQKATEILTFYEEFFQIPYPLPKQDLFAIPDFAAGAMENWGLITYREAALLYDSTSNPETSKEKVAVVIAHELAHQWFGNLVTLEWWDGMWLNEGFATFIEYIGTNSTEPSFDMLEQLLVDDVFTAFSADGLNESHPIVQTVSNPNEINALFDSISYSKGGTVIRMIRSVLGEENFQKGITLYLTNSKFGNAETQQLWNALQTVVKDPTLNVPEMMDTWTLQMGYPVLQVDTESGQVTQERFYDLKPNGTIASSPYDYVWQVPFNFLTEKDHSSDYVEETFKILRDKKETVDFPSDKGFIKVNVGQTGFYRVNYDLSNWLNLIAHLHDNPQSQILSPGDRAGLLEDVFGLSSAGLLNTTVALNLSRYIRQERDYVPGHTGLSWLNSIGNRLSLTATYGVYQEFVRNLTSDLAQEFNFSRTDLDHLQTFLRTAVLTVAWRHGNTEVINAAMQLFRNWTDNNVTIAADIKSVVYSVGVAYGSDAEWDFVWQRYLSSTDPYEKRLFLRALAESRTPWLLSRYLQYSIISSKVRSQDTLLVIGYVSTNVIGRYLTWNFVRDNWDYILNRYGSGSFSFSRTVTSRFTTEVELNEVKRFFEGQPDLGSGARAARQSIEVIKRNIQWLETNQDLISLCLSNTESCFA